MERLEAALEFVRQLDPEPIARHLQEIGFECTRCGRCCSAADGEPHTATVFPDEVRAIQTETGDEWAEIARPMPFGIEDGTGETFEWALQTAPNGDCTFLTSEDDRTRCSIYGSRPLLCQTYPFSLSLPGTGVSEDAAVESAGRVRASACPGLGAELDAERARSMAERLKTRAVRELEETIALREQYQPVPDPEGVIVHDSEGAKYPDGTAFEGTRR
ncbi:YkgJ family cysteine cluster protein [Halodesulfurarchaeum formicicum]|uniref:Fe-S oxidoreductase n=1 Tax=Halodesulfurarchaeum formicicum TaxID=1873524 RepID=A0A1J1AE16_9EURY|nr:YkgJ family cysteine cluster protein [Halodesulfurarchaeum formicicum]APE95967.1 hypothetical protein HSR6_1524 [Halodesulfurarchaeum formicicum]